MAEFFAGLTITLICVAAGIKLLKHAKRTADKTKAGKFYRIAAIVMFIGGCATVGTNFQAVASTLAGHLPGALVAFAAVFCGLGVLLDCIGKENHAGKGTVIAALVAPLLLAIAPMSVFGIDPTQVIREVKTVTTDSGIIQSSARD